jgi:hypothetical protein
MTLEQMTNAQHEAVDSGFIDLNTLDGDDYEAVNLSDIENTLVNIAAAYVGLLHESATNKDVVSSGSMIDDIQATQITTTETGYSIGITAPDYATYQDEGVNGWKVDRGSRFKFKTKGTKEGSPMYNSLKAWVNREGLSARNVEQGVTPRERRGMKMQSLETKTILSVAAGIKRSGIKPTHFWRVATNEINAYIETELAIATKIDIINNLYP